MKTIRMSRDFEVTVTPQMMRRYRAGITYRGVPEFQVRAILEAGAGEVVMVPPARLEPGAPAERAAPRPIDEEAGG